MTDPPQHTAQRKTIIRPFTPARLRSYEPMIKSVVDELIDQVIDRRRMEFVRDFAGPLPIIVTSNIMGLPREDHELFRKWGQFEGTGVAFRSPEEQRAQSADMAEMAAYLREAIRTRHEQPTDDAISEIIGLQIERDGEFDPQHLVAEIALLVAGGVVTTAHLIASAMMLLLQNPQELRKVRANHALIPGMLEEALRVESPVQWQPRRCVRDTEIGGVTIPEGATVLVLFGSANRDETVFQCPERLDVERDNVKSHMAFGYGPHFCLGAPLARLEGRIAFEAIFRRLGEIRLTGREDPEPIDSVVFRGPRELHIEFDPA